MIDPNAITVLSVGQLPSEVWSGTDNLPHEVGTDLKRGSVADLATYIAGIIDGSAGLAFNPLKISDGQTLPVTSVNEWIIVGQGTYLQSGGFANVVCVEDINIVLSNSTSWILGFGIAVDGVDTSQFVKKLGNETIEDVKTFVQSPIVPTATTSNQAVNLGQLNLQTVLDGGNSSTKGIVINETVIPAFNGFSENNFGVAGHSETDAGVFGYSENSTASIFEIGASNENNITEFLKNSDLKAAVTHDGKIIGTDATEPNQMVTLGQLNAISGDFIAKTGNTTLNPITGDLHSSKGFKSVWDEGQLDLASDNNNSDYRSFYFQSRGVNGTDFEFNKTQIAANPEEGVFIGVDNDLSDNSYQYINIGTQQSYIHSAEGETNITTKTVDNTTFSKPIVIENPTGYGIIANGFEAIRATGEDTGVRASSDYGTGIIATGGDTGVRASSDYGTGIIATGGDTGTGIIATGGSTGIIATGNDTGIIASSDYGLGIYAYGGNTGIYAYGNDNSAGIFNISETSTSNIVEFKKNSIDQATISHDGKVTSNGFIASNGTIRLKNYTVATLPTGTQGDTAYVTNALMPTYMATVVGGGNVVTPVFFNGTNWVCQ